MAGFERSGTFRDRARFLEALRERLERLKEGGLRGMTEAWETSGDSDVARLSGFGAKLEFTVGKDSWRCAAELPSWIPIPMSTIEEKFDKEMQGLSDV